MNTPLPTEITTPILAILLLLSLVSTLGFRRLYLDAYAALKQEKEISNSLLRASAARTQEYIAACLERDHLRHQATSIIAAFDSLQSRLSEPSIHSRLPHRFFSSFAFLLSSIEPLRTPPPGPPLDILPKPPPS